MHWIEIVNDEKGKPYFTELQARLKQEREENTVYPDSKDVFNAFKATPFEEVKVVIIGQDPYHDGSAVGLAFSSTTKVTPSLSKISEALIKESKYKGILVKKDLSDWATQGVFLINTVLTVQAGKPKSHFGIGWETFTEVCLNKLIEDKKPKVIFLWGKESKEIFMKSCLGLTVKHLLIIESYHPAYAAYAKKAWDNNNCFTRCNEFLKENNLTEIKWF